MEHLVIVVDYDGTIAEDDMLDRVATQFGDPELFRQMDEELDRGTITLHEVLRREFEPVTAPLDEVVAWTLAETRIRAGFPELVALSRERGWRLVVLSSDYRELIEPVLDAYGLGHLELVANRVAPSPAGWVPSFLDTAACDACGEPCKRATLRRVVGGEAARVVYVGDGYSDLCAAEAADLRFGRRTLATHLERLGLPFTRFEDFFQVAHTILTATS